jgi:hypothetical protein
MEGTPPFNTFPVTPRGSPSFFPVSSLGRKRLERHGLGEEIVKTRGDGAGALSEALQSRHQIAPR